MLTFILLSGVLNAYNIFYGSVGFVSAHSCTFFNFNVIKETIKLESFFEQFIQIDFLRISMMMNYYSNE